MKTAKPILFIRMPEGVMTEQENHDFAQGLQDAFTKDYYILLVPSPEVEEATPKVLSMHKVTDQLTDDEIKELKNLLKEKSK